MKRKKTESKTSGHGVSASSKTAQKPRFRNILMAVLTGGLLTAAWPTWGVTPVIFIALVPLLLTEGRVAWKRVLALIIGFLYWEYSHHLVGIERHSCRHIGLDTECALYGHRVLAVPPHKKESLQQSMGQFHPHPLLDGF